jgi:hypothetical protein
VGSNLKEDEMNRGRSEIVNGAAEKQEDVEGRGDYIYSVVMPSKLTAGHLMP